MSITIISLPENKTTNHMVAVFKFAQLIAISLLKKKEIQMMNVTNGRQHPAKLPIDPCRIRHMPNQFAPIDRRLVYDRHICHLTHQQLSLYVFLQCVGDAAGLSYYSDGRICEYLNFSSSQLHDARQALIQRQFVLYRKPIYQLLDLPQASGHRKDPTERSGETVAISAVINELCAAGL